MCLKTKPPAWAIRTRADELALQHCYWDGVKARAIVTFAHWFVKPQYVLGVFRLLQWQQRFLMSIYGWRWKEDGTRRFRFINLHISKKNGKTLLVSIICMFELFCSEEKSPYVAAAAASKENASQVFKELVHSIRQSPFVDHCKIASHTRKITVDSLNAYFCCFASRGNTVHGEPCSCIVIDECHAHTDPELFKALEYNIEARRNGFIVCISTAGNDTTHWYYQTYTKSKNILAGEDLDMTHYAEVYEADKASDYEKDESQWYKANPSLGTSFTVSKFKRSLLSAKSSIGDWLNFQRMRLNLWVRPDETAWLDVSDWSRFKTTVPEDELRQAEAVIGVDLSETTDPSSVSIVWKLPNNKYHVRGWAWVAEKGREWRQKSQLPKFDEFISSGDMQTTSGDMIDRDLIRNHILELCRQYQVTQVNFDPTSAYVMMGDIAQEGYEVGRIIQSHKNFNTPMVEFARAYKEGRVSHEGSEWLRYCFSSVRVEVNKYNEIRPYKKKSLDVIDGAVSTLLAFATIFEPASEPEIFRLYD